MIRAGCAMLALALSTGIPLPFSAQAEAPKHFSLQQKVRPNIVLIVADDLGYSDMGAFGGEIRTPNLDGLANAGVKLTNFHAAPQCSATRAMLLTGTDFHLTGLAAGAAEMLDERQRGQPGYEGYLNNRVSSIADLLRNGGYRTMMAGKWHLGFTPASDPAARGFERSFSLLGGADNHFGLRMSKEMGRTGGEVPHLYSENGKPVRELPKSFYSSDYFTSRLIGFLQESETENKPFFAYLAFSAPHYPIQALPEDIARYHRMYDEGWDVIRAKRIARQRELGLMKSGEAAHAAVPPPTNWDDLSAEQKRIEARKMEVYAAMVDRLDQNVGRLIEYLKSTGEFDNTIFVMMADNGAEGFAMEQSSIPANAEVGKRLLARGDNRLENLGNAGSMFWYGPGWGQAGSAPGYYYKHYPTEGGTRVPAVIKMPGTSGTRGISAAFSSVLDIAPTMLDWAGIKRGTDGKLPYMGKTMQPFLAGKSRIVHKAGYGMGMEFWGRRSYRIGDWKAVHIPPPEGSGQWMLFNLAKDPNETSDVAARHPAMVQRLTRAWDIYANRVGVVMPAQPGL